MPLAAIAPDVTSASGFLNPIRGTTTMPNEVPQQPDQTAPANAPQPMPGVSKLQDAHQITDLAEPEYDGPPLLTNIDTTTPEGRRLYMKKAAQSDLDAGQMAGQLFKLRWFIAERTTVKNQKTQQLTIVPRCILYDDAGRTVITAAWSIAHFMQTFIEVYGAGPWSPPVPIMISPARDKKGNSVYKVELWEGQTA